MCDKDDNTDVTSWKTVAKDSQKMPRFSCDNNGRAKANAASIAAGHAAIKLNNSNANFQTSQRALILLLEPPSDITPRPRTVTSPGNTISDPDGRLQQPAGFSPTKPLAVKLHAGATRPGQTRGAPRGVDTFNDANARAITIAYAGHQGDGPFSISFVSSDRAVSPSGSGRQTSRAPNLGKGAVASDGLRHQAPFLVPAVHLGDLLPALSALGSGQRRDGLLPGDVALRRLVVGHAPQGHGGAGGGGGNGGGGRLPPARVLVSVLRLADELLVGLVLPRESRARGVGVGAARRRRRRPVAHGQRLVGGLAAARTRGVVPPRLLLPLGVGFLLQLLTLPLLGGGGGGGARRLRSGAEVAIVNVLEVLGHGVLVVAVHSAFLLRPVGVEAVLREERGGGVSGGRRGHATTRATMWEASERRVSNVGLTIGVACGGGETARREMKHGEKVWRERAARWR
ncbi:hypothetical protein EYF80_056939 [Liparis tanakae]|uniref:Uncharacterized protein n=1 Tax=Liparis tanakae TaxID=230148 RepID=A0A4Z2EVR1_9TELE|nr:hypothetical protein EYF80_056939 [Liparis tanakae]